ncbi:MAG: arginine--tRNA ligase [SAR202 cluster bacterium Casp-Chloro-G4]|nr:arginine--tRNA ligase [Chloroflexota bacterium]MDA1227727.1 arginine--tRNA ligase [Chloroflexota bacterium]PKB61530.1 MAG: arginine--tRNA ligase [SAR202 cluster bacterium Casp-Chloro-G4]
MTIREDIELLVRKALADAQKSELLPKVDVEEITIERPQKPEHGDFASSLPLKLARPMRMNPMMIAEKLESLIPTQGILDHVSVAAPGFINFSLKQSWLAEQVEAIRLAGDTYGNVDIGHGQRVQIEFVSANPVGPLHVAHARGGVIGSALANIMEAAGYNVDREYYFNDAGAQIIHFKRTLFARYEQQFGRDAQVPEDGYKAEYMVDLAEEIKDEEGDRLLNLPLEQALDEIGALGLSKMMARIREDVKLLRINFDIWFNEATLFTDGQFEKSIQLLRDRGYVTENDGATWFASTRLGDERDKVLVRSNGIPTYFASDVAYHYNKFVERKYDKVINIWGADHQGHAGFIKAVIGALGLQEEKMTLVINQMVTLKRGGEVVRISKRTGDMITLRDVIDEVGPDACRYFFLSRDANSQMDFDMALAKEQSQENPVYYVQYAHARIASILRLAEERGIDFSDGDVSLLTHDSELSLIRKMLELPELIELITRTMEPHHLPHYSSELATTFHSFYQDCRVVSTEAGEEAVTKARLKLVDAARTALARCLSLMIMDAPLQM